jgi:hypothetical protein
MGKFAGRGAPSLRTVHRAVRQLCLKPLRQGVAASRADRYIKHYRSRDFALSLVWFFVLGLHSLRELHVQLHENRRLTELSTMSGISNAQLANLPHHRPSALWGPLVATLMARVQPVRQLLPRPVWALDATFFTLGGRLLARLTGRALPPENAGIKLSAVVNLESLAPQRTHVSPGSGHDARHAQALLQGLAIAGILFLFDRGYRKYQLFRDLIDRRADFITRASATDVFHPVATVLPDPEHPEIVGDELGWLGGAQQQRIFLRRIRLQPHGADEVVFFTSVQDLSAADIAATYARRWDIETFFRWLKRSAHLKRPLGYSLQAAEHTIMAALVVYLLALLLAETSINPKTSKVTVHIARAVQSLHARLHEKPNAHELRELGFY